MVNEAIAVRVKNKLLEYGQVLKGGEQRFTPCDEADKLIKENAAAFLFAVIVDQGARAEAMWEIPHRLKKIMGHLDLSKIAGIPEQELYQVFKQLPQKPRYWKTAARRIRNASQHVLDRYRGQAERIWNDNPKAGDLQSRLGRFDGIGQKKASMATRILGMDLNVPIRSWDEMDISVDEMIQRVFPRAGLSDTNSQQEIIQSARRLNPSFPGALDLPCWNIGRRWCHPRNPDCAQCYIAQVCPKLLKSTGNSL